MGRMSHETRLRVIGLWKLKYRLKDIQAKLQEEEIRVSKKSLCLLIRKYKETSSVCDRKYQRIRKSLNQEQYRYIDNCMAENKELTSRQLYQKLLEEFPGVKTSISSVKRARRELGWVCKRSRYCALITETNKEKRLKWCEERQQTNDLQFSDVIFTDECTIQLESHRKVCYRKKKEPAPLCAKPKHPPKINVWGGISARGSTSLVMFTGTLIATRYTEILETALIPFLDTYYPNNHRFQQDNDPKHTSRWAQQYFEEKAIKWWRTPASSPDLNPIELVWGSLKQYLRSEEKPRTIAELKSGVRRFWGRLTPQVCQRYIRHLKKVIPKVIEEKGGPSGY